MFLIYHEEKTGSRTRYWKPRRICLFGCKNGYIYKVLSTITGTTQEEPYRWHINMGDALREMQMHNQSFVIDLKPGRQVTLHKLLDIWGFSHSGWTPMLWRLQELVTDADPREVNRDDFTVPDQTLSTHIVYTTLWTASSVRGGKLIGEWLAPGPSPTNAVLLWPGTLRYFVQIIAETDPDILKGLKTVP